MNNDWLNQFFKRTFERNRDYDVLADISLFANMSKEQISAIERHVTDSFEHGKIKGAEPYEMADQRIKNFGIGLIVGVLTLIPIGLSATIYRNVMAPWPDPPESIEVSILKDPKNQWVLQGETINGDYLFIREPAEGVRCYAFYYSQIFTSSSEITSRSVGCVSIPISLETPNSL